MSSVAPELIFVAGPQQGERAALLTATALIGRSPAADVRLTEEAASREHIRFQFTRDGWVMENLSANGTLVNNKRYKRDKQILLDTGDVLGVGLETRILYVAPGDDPEEALQAWRAANPEPQAPKAPPKAAPPPPPGPADQPASGASAAPKPPPLPPGEAKKAKKPEPPAAEAAAAAEAAEGEETEKTSKLKLILLVIVMLGVIGFCFALLFRKGDEDGPTGPSNRPRRLRSEQIIEALEEPIQRQPSPTKARTALQAAVNKWDTRAMWSRPGELYRCVRQFELYRAYSQSPTFHRVADEQKYIRASRELKQMVVQRYEAAWKYEMARSYRNAYETFQGLLLELPPSEVERNSLIDRVLLEDIKQHIKFVNSRLGTKR